MPRGVSWLGHFECPYRFIVSKRDKNESQHVQASDLIKNFQHHNCCHFFINPNSARVLDNEDYARDLTPEHISIKWCSTPSRSL